MLAALLAAHPAAHPDLVAAIAATSTHLAGPEILGALATNPTTVAAVADLVAREMGAPRPTVRAATGGGPAAVLAAVGPDVPACIWESLLRWSHGPQRGDVARAALTLTGEDAALDGATQEWVAWLPLWRDILIDTTLPADVRTGAALRSARAVAIGQLDRQLILAALDPAAATIVAPHVKHPHLRTQMAAVAGARGRYHDPAALPGLVRTLRKGSVGLDTAVALAGPSGGLFAALALADPRIPVRVRARLAGHAALPAQVKAEAAVALLTGGSLPAASDDIAFVYDLLCGGGPHAAAVAAAVTNHPALLSDLSYTIAGLDGLDTGTITAVLNVWDPADELAPAPEQVLALQPAATPDQLARLAAQMEHNGDREALDQLLHAAQHLPDLARAGAHVPLWLAGAAPRTPVVADPVDAALTAYLPEIRGPGARAAAALVADDFTGTLHDLLTIATGISA